LRLLFDTDILIHALNGTATERTLELLLGEQPLPISIVTWMEVMVGATEETADRTRHFLSRFQVCELNAAVAEQAVIYRRQLRLKLPDAIIYATARSLDRTLVTLNVRDFPNGTESVLIP